MPTCTDLGSPTPRWQAYRDDPTIMIWELCNECRCRVTSLPRTQPLPLHEWFRYIAPKVKQLAPRQLISTGGDGFYYSLGGDGSDVSGGANQRNPKPDHDPGWFIHEGGEVGRRPLCTLVAPCWCTAPSMSLHPYAR